MMKTGYPDQPILDREGRDLDAMAVLHKLAEQSGDGMVTELYRLAMDRSQDTAVPRSMPSSRTRTF